MLSRAIGTRCATADGVLHDVYMDEKARRSGLASRLVEEAASGLARLGAPRLVLMTSAGNVAARRLLQRLRFRETMVEMTREVSAVDPGSQI